MNYFKRYQFKNFNFILVIAVILLSIIGILAVGSATPTAQSKQIFGVCLGIVVMLAAALIDIEWILNFYWLIYAGNLFLLLFVEFFGASYNGAQRWINLGFTTIQPSDLTKIFLILFFAKFLMENEKKIREPIFIIKCVLLVFPSLYLILKQPNLSTTICISIVFCVLMFLAGLSYRFIGITLAIVIPVLAIFIGIVQMPNQPFLEEYQQKRILAWLYPEQYASDTGYQQQNSIMAIGSGQLDGKGLNNNTTTSVKNGNFLLEADTDFIFAIIGEELGFIGCCLVIFLLLLIIIQCIIIGLKAQNLSTQIVCGGMAALIAFQSFINMGVATGVLPNTGLSLPFVSAGLTSIVCFYMGVGFVLNIGLQRKKY